MFQYLKGAIEAAPHLLPEPCDGAFQYLKGAIEADSSSQRPPPGHTFNTSKVQLKPGMSRSSASTSKSSFNTSKVQLKLLHLAHAEAQQRFQYLKGAIEAFLVALYDLVEVVFQYLKGAIEACAL